MLQAAGFEALSTEYFLYFPEWLFNRLSAMEMMLCKRPIGGQYAFAYQSAGITLSIEYYSCSFEWVRIRRSDHSGDATDL